MENTCHLGRMRMLLVKYCWLKTLLLWEEQQSLQEEYLMQSHGAMAFSEELCPLVALHCFAFWERQLHYWKQRSLECFFIQVKKVKSTERTASTCGTSPVASLIISSECRNEIIFLVIFPSEHRSLVRKRELGLQIGFFSGANDSVCSCSACAVLRGEVGRMEGSVSMHRAGNQIHSMQCSI